MASLQTLLFCISLVLIDGRVLQDERIHHLLSDDEVENVFGTSRSEVPKYDVVYPVLLDHKGSFVSHDVTHDNKRSASENLHFGLSTQGNRYHLNMKLNNDQFLAPNFVTEIRNDGKSRYDRTIDACHYIGHVETDQGPGDKVALSNCDGLTGAIQTKKGFLMIRPLPKRLGLDKRAHVAYLGYHIDVGRKFGMDVVRSSPREEEEPVSNDEQQDDVYSRIFYIEALVVVDSDMVKFHGSAQVKNYVLTLMNIVHSLIGDPSIGAQIKYVVNKLQILETYEKGFYVNTHGEKTLSRFCRWTAGQKNRLTDSDKNYFDNAVFISRRAFCADSYNAKSSSCKSILGLADLAGMCRPTTSCVLNHDSGLATAFTIAHETGHNLGSEHDGKEMNSCEDKVNIMANGASGKPTAFLWSSCSRKYIVNFLRGSQSKCLRDAPSQSLRIPTNIPGQSYSLDDQCKLMIKGSTGFCRELPDKLNSICFDLHCASPGGGCTSIQEPAAEGSNCGIKKVCQKGHCVDQSTYKKGGSKPIDGNFSAWSSWGKCSHTCGGGVVVRSRKCDNPRPQNFGKPCTGDYKEYKLCADNKACPSYVLDPLKKACIGKRKVRFSDGEYKWSYNPKIKVKDKERCKLTCVAPSKDPSYDSTFYTFGNVQDGIFCRGKGPRGVCIGGICKEFGCNNVIGSSAKKDQCGVCKGDGTSCSSNVISGEYNKVPDYDGLEYQKIVTIPAGARNIEIKEVSNSPNYLALKTASGSSIINCDYTVSYGNEKYKAAGTTFTYSQKGNYETITAKGPLTQAVVLQLWLDFTEYDNNWPYHKPSKYHVTYKYSKVSPSSRDAISQDTSQKYIWISTAKSCSASCGGGKRLVTVQCVRANDRSPASHEKCELSEDPEELSEECNTQPCPARWSVKEWGDCSKQCNDGSLGQQTREVMCVFTSAGEEEILADSDCKEPKPSTYQACGHGECPAEWVTEKALPCSVTCGTGVQFFKVTCLKTKTNGQKIKVLDSECPGDDKPPESLSCHNPSC